MIKFVRYLFAHDLEPRGGTPYSPDHKRLTGGIHRDAATPRFDAVTEFLALLSVIGVFVAALWVAAT